MKIDKPEHQQFLLELIKNVQLPGQFIDLAYEVKVAIQNSEICEGEDTETVIGK